MRNKVTLGYGTSGVDGTVRSATDGNGNTTTFGNTNSQLTSVTPQADAGNSVLGTTTLTYDGLGRVATVLDGKGITHTFTYDNMDRVVKDQVNASSYVAYTWDAVGNLKQRKEVQGATLKTTDYGYDALNRRTSETFPGYSNTYAYTLNSQLATLTDPGGTTSYEYDVLDRVSKVSDPGSAHVNYAYEDTGASGTPRNRLVTFPDSSMTQRTDFDRSGKPTLIVVKSGATVRSSRAYEYTWTGTSSSTTRQGRKISKVTDQDGTVTTYQYGQDGELVNAKRTTSGGSVTEWVHAFDQATNRKTLTLKRTGQADVVTTYAYNKVNQLCWAFAGGYALPNGLYHFGARYYNPAIGRWTQQDPLNQIGSLTEANRYAYVSGDPVNYIDPTGKDACGWISSGTSRVLEASGIGTIAGIYVDVIGNNDCDGGDSLNGPATPGVQPVGGA